MLELSIRNARTVLLAADQQTRHLLRMALGEDQYTLIEAANGEEVFDQVTRCKPVLVILTPDLPDIDGFTVCTRLRELPERLAPLVIMLLERDDEDMIVRAFEAGALDVVYPPVNAAVLRHRMNVLMQMRAMRGTLSDNEERYRIISTMISDYAYAYDVAPGNQLIKDWSTKAFETITGFNPSELDGEGWSNLIHPDDLPLAIARAQRLMAGEKDVTEFRIVSKDGHVRWLLDHGLPVWDAEEGRVVKIYGAAQDITERKKAEELLRQQTQELQARNEELDAFAHTVAHDLKNPIASMMGFTSLVLNYYDRMTDDKVREYLQLIMESGYKLKEIINSLLLLAGVNRMETVEIKPIDMSVVVNGARSRLTPMIDEQGAEIILPPRWPVAVGYAPWVEEIWANYLSNALKYGGQPPRIELGADDSDNGKVRFWIRDNGIGLTPDEQKQVFTPFTRLSQTKVEGHGLGLSVVQRIVERLNGEVGVESYVGQGSTFSFTLPAGGH